MKKSKRVSTRAGAQTPERSRRARASGVRAWIGALPLLACATVTACPGALDDPDRFRDGGVGGADNCGNIPQFLQQTCGAGSICHSADSSTALDLTTANVATRLVRVPGSQACGEHLLIDPDDPANSLLLLKLEDTPPCGSRMPLGPDALTAEQKACLRTWVNQVVGAVGTGGTSGTGGGAGTSGAGGTGGAAGNAGTAGTGGRGGTAGMGGRGGTAGMAGSAGKAGMGGTAGMAGNAGTAGMAGSSGMAGMSGNAGNAGNAGMGGSAGDDGGAGDGGMGGVADGGTD